MVLSSKLVPSSPVQDENAVRLWNIIKKTANCFQFCWDMVTNQLIGSIMAMFFDNFKKKDYRLFGQEDAPVHSIAT